MQRTDERVDWSAAVRRCPKTMQHGPCAGVRDDGGCEVPGHGRCDFLDVPVVGRPYADGPVAGTVPTSPQRPLIIADLPAAALSARSIATVATALGDSVDACLLGDNGLARVQFPPSYRVRLLTDAGVRAWAGLNCRDRNRVALEGEIAACLDAGAAALHCVTGDHTALGHRPDAAPVFDLDSVGLVELAAGRGVPCSVAHAPSAPPRDIRLPRLLAKLAAGADTVFVDHCGGPATVRTAVAELRATGFAGRVIACVPVAVDEPSARVLLSFAAGAVPPGYVESIVTAADPRAAGIAAAVTLASELLAIDGVDGVNLSGGPLPGSEVPLASAMAEMAALVRLASAVPA